MKKIYNQPELEIVIIENEIATATTTSVNFDLEGLFGQDADSWF